MNIDGVFITIINKNAIICHLKYMCYSIHLTYIIQYNYYKLLINFL